MPLSANLPAFKRDMKDLINKHSKNAFKSTFTQKLSEGHNIEAAVNLTAQSFADEFSKIAPEMCDLINKHVLSALLTPVLVDSKAGPVQGKITIS